MSTVHRGASALIPTYATYPFELTRGSGMRVWDATGRSYLDFYGGHAVASLGHAAPALAEALASQALRLSFYSNVAPLEIRDRAARALAEYAGPPFTQVFFCNSGTEANEAALKVAIQRTGRSRIAALSGAFHGRTLLSLSATDGASYRKAMEPLLAPCARLRPNQVEDLELLDETVAAVIVEPVQSMAGVVTLSPEYLKRLRARTSEVGALLIYDEVQTGNGRVGRAYFGSGQAHTPDLITTAKGLGGGFPVGAVLFTEEIASAIREGDLGSTFGGGPLACAAVLATLGVLETERLHERVTRVSAYARRELAVGPVEAIRGEGWLLGLVTAPPAREVYRHLLGRGILTGTSGDPNVLRLLPPLIATEADVDALRAGLESWKPGQAS